MKKSIGTTNLYYPTLTILAGANVNGKPNYEAIAWGGVMKIKMLYFSSSRSHYTNQGVHENKTFSINIPSIELLKETDYCGMHSGSKIDKSKIFNTFYGKLDNAPMITECPVNMECELTQTFVIGDHDIFIGKIVDTYCDEEYMTNGKADLKKIQPFFFSFIDSTYWKLGECFEKAFSAGGK